MAATTADRVVTELIADTSGHDPKIRTSAQVVEQAATQIERSANKAESAIRSSSTSMIKSFDATAQRSRLLGFQIADVGAQLAGGQSPFLIIAQQAPQVANALDGAKGAAGRMATFFSGPWGAALLAGGSILGVLVGKLFEHKDALTVATEKLRENARQTEATRIAKELFARTIEGNVAAIHAETEALEAQNRSMLFNQALTEQRNRDQLQRGRDDLRTLVDQLRTATETLRERERAAANVGPDEGVGPAQALVAAEQRVIALTAAVKAQQAAIADAERNVRLAQGAISTTVAEAAVDPLRRINLQYDVMAQNARSAAAGNDALTRSLTRTLTAIEARRQSDLRAEQARQAAERQSARDAGRDLQRPVPGGVLSPFGADRSGVPLNGRRVAGRRHDGVDLAGRVGDPVVAPQGGTATVRNAPGGLGMNVVIVGAGGARDILAHLSAAFGPVGSTRQVSAGDVIGRVGTSGNAAGGPPHLHWQRNENGQWVDPLRRTTAGSAAASAAQAAERAAAAAERDRLERERNEAAFQAELGRQNEALLQARRRNVATVEEQVRLEIEQIDAARDRQNASYDAAVVQGRMTQAQANQLKELNNQTAVEERRTVQIREQLRLDQQRYQIAAADLRDATSIEQARGQLADTVAERYASELRLLDLSKRAELAAIQNLRDDARARGELNAATAARLDRAEAAVNERYSLERQRVDRDNEGPRARYLRELRNGAADINTQLEEIEVRGLQALDDSAKSALKSVLGLHGALGDIISDLIMIFIRQQALSLFGGGGGGFSLGSLFGGGGGASAGADAWLAGLVGFASGGGGIVRGRAGIDQNVVSINGQPSFRVSSGEFLGAIPQGKAVGFQGGAAMSPNGAGQQQVRLRIETTSDWRAEVMDISSGVSVEVVQRAAPEIVANAKAETLRSATRPRLNRN